MRYPFFCRVLAALGLLAIGLMALSVSASAIPPPGEISGEVTDAAHAPIAHANICVTAEGSSTSTCETTEAAGKYSFELKEGVYTVDFNGYVCAPNCEPVYVPKLVEGVSVTAGHDTVQNAEMLEPGKISGRVTSGGAPANEDVQVCAFEVAPGFEIGCKQTNANGEYTIEHLAPGSYTVSFNAIVPSSCNTFDCQRANFLTQYWNGQLTREAANDVNVEGSKTTTGINAEMRPGGHISGRVTNGSIYAQPIAGLEVCATLATANKEGEREPGGECAYTNANGEYSIPTLTSGGYEVEFSGLVCTEPSPGKVKCPHPYIGQFYQGIVFVTAPGTTSGINGGLLEASPVKPANTGAPMVTVGVSVKAAPETLSCSQGSWTNNPTSLTYRWLRNGVAIAGQSANTYTVQSADAGTGISCEVIASNLAGAIGSKSNTVQIPKPAPGVAVFKSASVKGNVVSMKLLCTGASACSGKVKIIARVGRGHGKHKKTSSTTIGSASFSIALGKTSTSKLHLTGTGSKLLSHAGNKGLKVQISGSAVKVSRTALKPPSKRR